MSRKKIPFVAWNVWLLGTLCPSPSVSRTSSKSQAAQDLTIQRILLTLNSPWSWTCPLPSHDAEVHAVLFSVALSKILKISKSFPRWVHHENPVTPFKTALPSAPLHCYMALSWSPSAQKWFYILLIPLEWFYDNLNYLGTFQTDKQNTNVKLSYDFREEQDQLKQLSKSEDDSQNMTNMLHC